MANQNYVKISTPIRNIRSEIGQVRISLYNDQVGLSFQPASGQKTSYGGIKYNGSPNVAANVRFSVGVGSAIANLIKQAVIPAADSGASKHWDVFACKRGQYESYLSFDVQNGNITMTGVEINNGQKKQASYSFPVTVITDGDGKNLNVQGEALALADLFTEISSANDMPIHIKQYNQAVKDNMPTGGYDSNSNTSSSPQHSQPMNNWRPYQ